VYTLRRRSGGEYSAPPSRPPPTIPFSAPLCVRMFYAHFMFSAPLTCTLLPLHCHCCALRYFDGLLRARLLETVRDILIKADPKPERRRFQDKLVQEIKRVGKDKASAGDVIVLLCNFIDAKYASDMRTGTIIRNVEGFLQSLLGRFLMTGFAPGHYEGFPNGAPSWRGR